MESPLGLTDNPVGSRSRSRSRSRDEQTVVGEHGGMASLERQLACGACLVAAAAIRPAFVSLGYLPAGVWLLRGRPLAPA
eukprot:COSAG04_NODE_1507_length_6504_cov_1.860734_10_plen_79_part_01